MREAATIPLRSLRIIALDSRAVDLLVSLSDHCPVNIEICRTARHGWRSAARGINRTTVWAGVLLLLLAGPPVAAQEDLRAIESLAEAGRFDDALAQLEPLVEANPDVPEPRFLLGNILTGLGRYDDAIDAYVALTRDFPGRPEPHNNLAVIFVEQGRLEEARTALLAAARLRPGYARARDNLGDLYLLMADQAYARAAAIREAVRASGEPGDDNAGLPRADSELTPAPAPRASVASAPAPADETQAAGTETEADRRQPSPVFALVDRRDALAAVERWRAAWSAQDIDGYLAAYVDGYSPNPQSLSNAAWREQRRARVSRPDWIEVELVELSVEGRDENHIEITFEQQYRASNYSDTTRKRLIIERTNSNWQIAEERSL